MTLSRRDAIAQLAAITAMTTLPRHGWTLPSPSSDPLDGTIAEYLAGFHSGKWSAEEVTRAALERCQRLGTKYHAIDALSETAIADAKASDVRRKAKRLRGALDGVPVFGKAIYDMDGLPTTASNAEWARLFPDPVKRDSIEIQRLRAAGAIVLGKTAADDFAYRGEGTSSHTGQVLNPYDRTGTRTPGGSSAGSAVSVACGMAFAALGTDDGGSNRIPAVCTGVVGMKPTFGLVPRNGVIPTWPYLDTHGPLARHVADAALLLSVVAGPDPSDPLALTGKWDPSPLLRLRDNALHRVRLGLVEAHVPRAQMTEEALATWNRAVADLQAAGAEVVSFDAPVTLQNYRAQFAESASRRGDVKPDSRSPAPTANAYQLYFAGRSDDPRADMKMGYPAYQQFYDVLPKTFEECEPLFDQPMAQDAAGQSFARSRTEVVAALEKAMEAAGVSAMVYPTMPFNAFSLETGWPDLRTALGYGNFLGLPEVSVPAGLGADGMPALNLSVVGLPGTDAQILAFAHAYERQSKRFVAPK